MERQIFEGFDFTDFWEYSDYAQKEYVEDFPNDQMIEAIQQQLGYKLPSAYIALMKIQNGGIPRNTCYPTTERTSWADDHIAITGIMGIGKTKQYSLCGRIGSQFMTEEWGYPNTGIYVCDCPSGGHDMVMLDYTKCGKEGEPEVVHIDQECNYKKTFLAKDFETFIRGLVSEDIYDTSAQDLINTLEKFKSGDFSNTLKECFAIDTTINFDKVLRKLFTDIATEKGYFALHADKLSYLAYDIQFYLLSISKKIISKEMFLTEYPKMLLVGNNLISTGGYAPKFIEDWFDESIKTGKIIITPSGRYHFSNDYKEVFLETLKAYQ